MRRHWPIGNLEQCENRTLLTTLFGVTPTSALIQFDSAAPASILSSGPITDIWAGETIQGIDFCPTNGQLFALTTDADHTGRLYTIDPATAIATLAATIDAPVTGTSFGVGFNPISDELRVASDTDLDLRINVTTGVATSNGPLAYLTADPSAGQDPNVVGSAFDNLVAGATATTLYQIDSNLDILAFQEPANQGALTTVGALGVDASAVVGFDIWTSGSLNLAYASLVVGSTTNLYQIDLTSGAATLIAPIGTPLKALAFAPEGYRSKVDGLSATLTGSLYDDTLVIDQSAGLLRHNQFALGVPGFQSAFDFDTTLPGDQTLSSADPAVIVIIDTGLGINKVTLGSTSAPLSHIAAAFTINSQGQGPGNAAQLTLEDSTSSTARNISVVTGRSFEGLGGPIRYTTAFGARMFVTLNAGTGNDFFDVLDTPGFTLTQVHLNGGGGVNTLNAHSYSSFITATTTSISFKLSVSSRLPYLAVATLENIETVNATNVAGNPITWGPPETIAVAGHEFVDRLVAQFINRDPGAKASDYQVTIQWGDGTSSPGVVSQNAFDPTYYYVRGSHRYSALGHFTVTTTIRDMGGTTTVSGPGFGTVLSEEAGIPIVWWGDPGIPTTSPIYYPFTNTVDYHIYAHGGNIQYQYVPATGPTVTVTNTYLPEAPLSLESPILVIDPPITVDGGLVTTSDTGFSDQDGITNDNTPTFTGTSAPGAVVQIFNGSDPATRQLIATGVADSLGAWQATAPTPLADGLYQSLVLEATSVFGQSRATSTLANLMVDTVGPTVTNLQFRLQHGQLNVSIQDDRSGLNQAGITDRASYDLTAREPRPRRNRLFPITGVTTTPQGNAQSAQLLNLSINNGRRFRTGRFTYIFTARSGGIADLAGNAFDGEFTGRFPSGNAQPGGNFVAALRPRNRIGAVSSRRGASEVNLSGGNSHPAGPNPGAHFTNFQFLKTKDIA
ncbi:DUF4394 domain-containing protein [Singulisphaera sp. Ch08]|uniref:DUF4394 domain-containing protein n=1 Tax=Singulisphaera sp. Ch08 TaxID=3120278 RepID=A0AAU7CKT4_9BACT